MRLATQITVYTFANKTWVSFKDIHQLNKENIRWKKIIQKQTQAKLFGAS